LVPIHGQVWPRRKLLVGEPSRHETRGNVCGRRGRVNILPCDLGAADDWVLRQKVCKEGYYTNKEYLRRLILRNCHKFYYNSSHRSNHFRQNSIEHHFPLLNTHRYYSAADVSA
jgi:hypothetical protein